MALGIGTGDYVDYTPGTAVTGGTVVVQESLVGLAESDIAANALGALLIRGLVKFDKTAGSGEAIAAGAVVYWDASGEVATTTASTHKKIGYCAVAASDSATTVDCLLTPIN